MLPAPVGPSTALWWGGCLTCGGVKLMPGQAGRRLTHVLTGTHGQGSPSNNCRQRSPAGTGRSHHAAISRQLCLISSGLAWPPLSLPTTLYGQVPPACCGVPLHKGRPGHRDRGAGTALDCPLWLCSVLFLLLPVPCALPSLCPPLGTTSLSPSPSHCLVNNSAGFCARCTLSSLWRDRWFWA